MIDAGWMIQSVMVLEALWCRKVYFMLGVQMRFFYKITHVAVTTLVPGIKYMYEIWLWIKTVFSTGVQKAETAWNKLFEQ